MTDTSQGHGWWTASDGKWYPPEFHPSQHVPPEVDLTSPEETVKNRVGWWLAADGEWYPPRVHASVVAAPAEVAEEVDDVPAAEPEPEPQAVPDVAAVSSEPAETPPGASRRGPLVPVAIGVVVVALIVVGIVLATSKSSPPKHQTSATTTPTTSPVSSLIVAARHTLAASSLSVSITGGLGSASSSNGDLPLLNERLSYQAPNRVSLSNLVSIYGGRATFVHIGTDCWIAGLPPAGIATGAPSCASPGLPVSPSALLQPLTTATNATNSAGTLTFSPANAVSFVKSMGISLNPLASGVHVAVQVQVTLTGSFIGSEVLTISQTGGSGGSLTAQFQIHVSGINQTTVPRPTSSPTAVDGVLSTNP